MMKKLTDCKFEISERSPEWHQRYNDIIDFHAKSRESTGVTSISSLTDDDCIILAMSLAKLAPKTDIHHLGWEKIEERIHNAQVISIPEPDKITFRVILKMFPSTHDEASLFLRVTPYTWADTEHLSFITLAVGSDAISREYDMGLFEAKAKSIFHDRCLLLFHEMKREDGRKTGLITKLWQDARYFALNAKFKLNQYWY